MKRFNFYLSLMLLLVFTAACSDEFDQPPMVVPTAEHTANMTIAEFKAKHWQDARNYIDTVTEDEIIHGWVTSSDESGNIYKNLYIMDESGQGLTISINQNSLYNSYRIGQEIVLPMKGYFVGKYNGQQQLGYPQWYAQGNAWEATFLPQAMWESMVEVNGLPNPSMIDTLEISLSDIYNKSDVETQLKYQSRLVRINDVSFSEADGKATYVEGDASTNRTLIDDNNRTLLVRNSNYADFKNDVLPQGKIDVVGLLYFYGTNWQLYLRSVGDVMAGGMGGTKNQPLTVDEAIAIQNTGTKGWVGGYVVGAVAPEVTTVTSNNDIEWQAPTTLPLTLVIAPDADCKDYTKCIIVPLPTGSQFRIDANLQDNEWLYKQYVKVKGTFASYMGAAGITGNTGSTDEYVLPAAPPKDGVLTLEENFEGSLPAGWTEVVYSGSKHWYYATYQNDGYAGMTGFNGSNPPYDAWYISPAIDIKNAASKILTFKSETRSYGGTKTKFEVCVLNSLDPKTASVNEKLNPILAVAPNKTGTYSAWTASGDVDLSKWANGIYYIGFHYYAEEDTEYDTWCIDAVTFGLGGSTPPPTPAMSNRGDFETMGDAQGQYSNFTSTNGWVATNCCLLQGGTADSNPTFQFIGYMTGSETEFAKAPTLNGKTTSVGTLVSPVISGGMKKLTFNYGAAFNEAQLAFRVDVKQGGNVVKSWEVRLSTVATKTKYEFSEACDINGDFTIEITNLCPSAATGNKDRVSIWNLVWE